ncbi:MAG: DsbE family thiol:disulfide interchange protein, partial [Rhodobacteraceae bacterium]|nr:DsbE family thiol:disulfide interchange protein [Paracoccaceae bacterium]
MAKFSPLMILPPVLFAAFAGAAYFSMTHNDPERLKSMREGKPAPALPEEALPGYPAITPDMLRSGEVTLVNFWATWCPPCRAEHPKLMEMQASGIRIIGVNYKDGVDAAKKYLTEEGNPFMAVGSDPQGRAGIDWGVTGPPETFIVDGDGTVLFRFAGPLVGSDYEQRF